MSAAVGVSAVPVVILVLAFERWVLPIGGRLVLGPLLMKVDCCIR